MNRRTAMFLTMLMGGLVPRGVLAQGSDRRRRRAATRGRGTALEPAADRDGTSSAEIRRRRRRSAGRPTSDLPGEPGSSGGSSTSPDTPASTTEPVSEPAERDHRVDLPADRHHPLARRQDRRPQREPVADPRVQRREACSTRLDEVIERFTNAVSDFLSIRVRFVAAVDTRWRYAVYSRLTPVGSGPQGQQIWTLQDRGRGVRARPDAGLPGIPKLLDQPEVEMVNGQTLMVEHDRARAASSAGCSARAPPASATSRKAEKLEEGVHPPPQPPPDLRRRRRRRGDRPDGQHGQERSTEPGHRPPRGRPDRDHDRRPRGRPSRGSTRRSRAGRSVRRC